jgi:hypothetical protein
MAKTNAVEQYEKDRKKLGKRVADALHDENSGSKNLGRAAINLRGAHGGHVDHLWRRP